MIDLAAPLAVGLAAFMAGAAYASRRHAVTMRDAAAAGAIVIDARAYTLAPLHPDPKPVTPPTPASPEPVAAAAGASENAQ